MTLWEDANASGRRVEAVETETLGFSSWWWTCSTERAQLQRDLWKSNFPYRYYGRDSLECEMWKIVWSNLELIKSVDRNVREISEVQLCEDYWKVKHYWCKSLQSEPEHEFLILSEGRSQVSSNSTQTWWILTRLLRELWSFEMAKR